jgi:aminotransferase
MKGETMVRVARWIEDLHDRAKADEGAKALISAAGRLDDVIRLNSGDPDRIAPVNVVEAATAALRAGKTRYSLGPGLAQLRRAIAEKHRRENGFSVDPETQISVTNGSFEAIATVMRTLLDEGDEVITTDPYYGGHVSAIRYAGGSPVLVPTDGERGFELDPDEVAQRITARTRALIYASPGNPTGAVLGRDTLAALCELAVRHDLVLVADELFERYIYEGATHISAAALPQANERVITVHGFSKSYCMTGWRLGWVAAPEWFMRHFHKVRYASSMCANTFAQYGAVEALSPASEAYYRDVWRDYGQRRDIFFDAWLQVGLPQRPAPGAFVTMIDIRPIGKTAEELAGIVLNKARTLIWPGTRFGSQGEGYLRAGLVEPIDRLTLFAERLKQAISDGQITA